MGKENLNIFLNDFIEERLEENYQEILQNDKYKIMIDKYKELFNDIKESIENKKILKEFKEAEIDIYAIQLIKAYKKGFEDSILILGE